MTVESDSDYAQAMVTGRWKPRANVRIVIRARRLFHKAALHTRISFVHVDGYTGEYLNTRADRLAALGANCMTRRSNIASVFDVLGAGLADADATHNPTTSYDGFNVDPRRRQPALFTRALPHS